MTYPRATVVGKHAKRPKVESKPKRKQRSVILSSIWQSLKLHHLSLPPFGYKMCKIHNSTNIYLIKIKMWNFCEKLKFLWKIEIFVKNWNFCQKLKYLWKIEIFVKNPKFVKNPNFSQESKFFVKNTHFSQESKFLSKIHIFSKKTNFCEKSKFLSKIQILSKIKI